MRRQLGILSIAVMMVAGFASTAYAGGRADTLRVCSNGPFRTIQSAVNAAHNGDTVQICAGTYVEGNGARGSNALTITKNLTISGAGADLVHIEARKGAQLAESHPDIRSGKGVVVAVVGANVAISGVTVDANGANATAGIAYVNSQGSITRSRVTGVDVDESATGYTVPGGFRSNPFGYGIAHVGKSHALTIDHTRVDHYNAAGVVIDGSGNTAVLTNDQIAGRNLCQNFDDPTAGGPVVIDGDCQASGGSAPIPPPLPLASGPLFGQDGVRVSGGAAVRMVSDTVSSNLVNGQGAPIQSVYAPTPNNDPYPLGDHSENNQNLRLAAGVRLVGAAKSSITESNITDNAFGVLNTTADGTTANSKTPVRAQNNWWGLRTGTVTLPTPGPAVWSDVVTPSTINPPVPENPVNGKPVASSACPSGVSDSDAVTFCPYRASDQSDSAGGEFPVANAPGKPSTATSCSSTVQFDPTIPSYDEFFGTSLGSGVTGGGGSGTNPSAKKTAQLTAYMRAVVDAVNRHGGSRVAAKMVQEGTSVLGVPFYYVVIGTPGNIANLDAGRNDQKFWRGVIDGTTSPKQALAQVDKRPAFAWITGTPHGSEVAGGEASVKELYELAARTDCDNTSRLGNLDTFIQPVTAPDDRDHNNRTTAWSFDPNRDRGVFHQPENAALISTITKYPGLFFIDAHQQSSGYFFPPDQDAAHSEISHSALDSIQDVIGPAIQNAFNDQSGQYRNYNNYDMFVPEYGDTVPALLQGGAGMTYEKGNNENYGKQVYDHYLAIDTTVNVTADNKDALQTAWIKQWPEAVDQGADCTVQENTQVSPPVVDQYEIGQSAISQEPNTNVCGYYYLPGEHSGDVAETIGELQAVGVNVYQLGHDVTVSSAHQFGDFDVNAPSGQSPVRTSTVTLPKGTLYIPLDQGTKHWIQAVLGENPYLPFNYNYDVVTWSYSLLRGFAGDGFLTQPLPKNAKLQSVDDVKLGTTPSKKQAVYAFNTDSAAALAMVNQLLGQGASVSRASTGFDANGTHFDTGAALVSGVAQATLAGDAAHWQTPVYGLTGYPVAHQAVTLPKIAIYTGGTTVPTNPAFPGTGDGYCVSTNYCEAMFDLTQREGIPTSQIGQLTSTDLANGVLQSGGYTVLLDPNSAISATTPVGTAGTPAQALRAFVNAGGTLVGTSTGGVTSARNAGLTTVNTNTVSGITTPGSTFDATWNTADPAGWGMDAGGWIFRSSNSDPNFDPTTLGGDGGSIPRATAVATFGPAGDCGGPVGFGNCYGYEVNANANLPGRPAVIDQPFGAGHAIMLGFDPWYRSWTVQGERLVLNAMLYPSGSASPVSAARLPQAANRPVHPSGGRPDAPIDSDDRPQQ
ncbi:hypothetical protein GCM10023322_52710 [Rugosimonospora acidiphila]|uniref:Zinc carboxypeptidase n=1 Tax=Rugosimonospora acidiphila TaxID=556531 RepID=A0ABP9S865_9ACTN